jgi:outer membrane protein TolC
MKKLLILLLLSGWLPSKSVAQTDFIPAGPYDNLSIENKLVQLAWNARSEGAVIQNELAIADQEVKVAKWAWADNFRASFNLNEFTIRSGLETGEGLPFFPRYNLSLALVLGDVISNPAQTKIVKQQRLITQAQRANAQLDLRAEVLEAYYNYLLSVSLYQISTEQNEEAYTNFLMVSEKFKTGEETLGAYNEAQQMYNATRADLTKLETQVKIAQLQLERYIGVPLEEVLSEEN